MSDTTRNSRAGLTAKITFTSLCLVTGTFALSEPGWSAMLKAQGYYADLSLDLFLAAEGVSGMPASLTTQVANHGPDAVDGFEIWFAGDHGISVVDSRCTSTDGGSLCSLPIPIGVGQFATASFDTRIASSASGALGLGGFVQSDLIDLNRANDIDAGAITVTLMNSVGVFQDFEPDQPTGDHGRIRFSIENAGPGDAPLVRTYAWVNGSPADFDCVDAYLAGCTPDGIVAIGAGGSVVLSFAYPSAYFDLDGYVYLDVFLHSETGTNVGGPVATGIYLPAQMISTGFE